jgi:hypothetical protein
MIYCQDDGDDSCDITTYYLEWTDITYGEPCTLTGITWYEDCTYTDQSPEVGEPDDCPTVPDCTCVKEGDIFVYVPKFLEISDDNSNWYKAMEAGLPLVCEDVGPGDTILDQDCHWYMRINLDGVTSFRAKEGVTIFPLETFLIEGEEQIATG